MAGPYPPYQGGPPPGFGGMYPPQQPGFPVPDYPGALPPPVPYPKPRPWRLLAGALGALVVIAAIVAGVVLFATRDGSADGKQLTSASAKSAIQTYLDALSNGNTEVIARNALCGLYDGVRDRRSDEALAKLSSDAFQKQFSKAEVTSVDTMVFTSPTAAQVLFSMKVAATMGGRGSSQQQGVAQLIEFEDRVLVCSYVLRTAGTF